MRFAIYARYSSDLQNPKSIEDQISACSARIGREGGSLVRVYSDAAASGAHAAQRPEYQQLLADLRLGLFDAAIAEDLDRFGRSLEDAARLHTLAEHFGIALWTLADGRITRLHTGLKGLMSELFLKQLADKTRRGLMGVVNRGGIPGGRCYGYSVAGKAQRAIDTAEKAIVIRIYTEYAAGMSPRRIATRLNAEGIPGPRGGLWRVSTLIGNPERLNGTLNNPIYRGKLTFNRQRFSKDPDTGRRIARRNPPEIWITEDHPELRIVSEELWIAVAVRREALGKHHKLHNYRRHKTLLSGLVRCEECGAPMTKSGDYFRCTGHLNSGTCGNTQGVKVSRLESGVITALRQVLDRPDMLGEFTRVFHAECERLQAEAEEARAAVERRKHDLDRRIANLLTALEQGTAAPSLSQRLAELESERDGLRRTAPAKPPPFRPTPEMPRVYRQWLGKIETILTQRQTPERAEATERFRSLISGIYARRGHQRPTVTLEGYVGAILQAAGGSDMYGIVRCGKRI